MNVLFGAVVDADVVDGVVVDGTGAGAGVDIELGFVIVGPSASNLVPSIRGGSFPSTTSLRPQAPAADVNEGMVLS